MNEKNRKIRDSLRQFSVPPYDPDKMRQTIRLSEKTYRERLLAKRIGFWEFIRMQVRFIGRWVWLAQAAFLLVCLFLLNHLHVGKADMQSVFLLLSSVAPLIAFVGFPEILKSYANNMGEIEACTRFSMRKLMGARMLILGLADLCCLTVILAASTAHSGLPFLQMILYLFVPFNVTCCGCLTVLDHVKSRQGGYFCAAVCIFCIALFSRLSLVKEYYEAAATGIWAVLFFCSLVYFVIELIRTFRNFDALSYSQKEMLSVPW